MSLYVSSHYKNSPDDLQLLSDAPHYHLFALLGPIKDTTQVPDIFCIIQACIEGKLVSNYDTTVDDIVSKKILTTDGNLIPWCMFKQYQKKNFFKLSGLRIVRIAVHPELQNMGYGTRAMQQLLEYYYGNIYVPSKDIDSDIIAAAKVDTVAATNNSTLHTETIELKKNQPPLFLNLNDRAPDNIDWIGVSFGITNELYTFWKQQNFVPLYIRQTPNKITGEYTCIMIHYPKSDTLLSSQISWIKLCYNDFKKRFIRLLGYQLRSLSVQLCTLVLTSSVTNYNDDENDNSIDSKINTSDKLDFYLNFQDIKRLESYAKQIIDHHVIIDLVPTLATLYFLKYLDNFHLSTIQVYILAGIGLQMKNIDILNDELNINSIQLLALFNKIIKKFVIYFNDIEYSKIKEEINSKIQTPSPPPSIDKVKKKKSNKRSLVI